MKTKMTALLLACCLALNAMADNLEIENLKKKVDPYLLRVEKQSD